MPLTQVSSRAIEDTLRYVLGASGTNHYTFTGKGLNGAVNDPTIYLVRGHTYIFENRNSSGAHPFYIKTSIANGGTNDQYSTGVTNNGGAGGTEITFTVPHDAPDTLYYQCSSHSSMAGEFKIAGSVADGSITESKLADDAVTADKLADSINSAIAANTAKDLTALSASNLTSGTVPDARFPATLPAISGANLTGISTTPADGSITEAKLANNAVTNSKIADTAISQAKLNFPVSNKNVVINGECLIAQRATSATSVSGSPAFTYDTVDRFVYGRNTNAVVNLAQEDDAPVGFKKCLQLRVTTAATSTSYARIVYRIEDTDVYRFGFGQSGTRYLTLSFYHKHTQAGTNCVMIQNPGYNRSYIAEYTQSVANTWERATITFPVDTGNYWSPSGGRGMQIQWGLTNADAQGSANTWTNSNIVVTSNQYNHLGAVDNYFRLTGVQLELGSVATDFEHRSLAVEERLCKRYFCKYDSPLNINFVNEHANNKKGYLHFPYEEVMRDSPSVAFSNVNISRPQVSVGISITEAQNIQRRCFNLVAWPNGSTLGSHGDAYYRMSISSGGYVTCDAEL